MSKFLEKVKKILKIKNKDNEHFISKKEVKNIAKENSKKIKYYEKKSKQSVTEKDYTAEMKDSKNILEVDNLHTYFFTDAGTVKAVDGATFSVPQGSTVGIVGESGCGKSVTSLSIMRLVQAPQGQIVEGSIKYMTSEGKCYDIAKMPISDMQKVRGKEISMIFQEPMTSLNPVFTIGFQIDEITLLHFKNCTKAEAKTRSIEMLKMVGIANVDHIYNCYPHELSGGMRQRVMIAMSLVCNPRLIIADEPTTALDVTIQAQILDLLREIKNKISGSIMLITHDLGVVAEMADYVVVMYAGRVVEMGTAIEIFKHPCHPYTIGLQKSKPVVNKKVDELYSIPGQVPNTINLPSYCYFKDRCNMKNEGCNCDYPEFVKISDTHIVACHLYK